MNSVTCSSDSTSIFISTVFCCFPIVIVLAFSTLILSPNLWLLLCTLSVSSCSCPSSSATRSMSSANFRLLTVCPPTLAPASVDFKAKLIIASMMSFAFKAHHRGYDELCLKINRGGCQSRRTDSQQAYRGKICLGCEVASDSYCNSNNVSLGLCLNTF